MLCPLALWAVKPAIAPFLEDGMRKFYLFQDKRSKITHAVETKWKSLGSFELDRVFGGDFIVLCGREAYGAGILSATLMDPAHTTCKKCIAALKKRRINTDRKPTGIWPPPVIRKLDKPRIFGIPG